MTLAFGLAMMAIAILSIRGAMIYAVSPAVPAWFRDFLNGSVATLLILAILVTGLMVFANTLFMGIWKENSLLDVLAWAVISGGAVLAWIGLGRMRHPSPQRDPADIVNMPSSHRTPPETGVVGARRRTRKRAA